MLPSQLREGFTTEDAEFAEKEKGKERKNEVRKADPSLRSG
jgi:hypothetical protein